MKIIYIHGGDDPKEVGVPVLMYHLNHLGHKTTIAHSDKHDCIVCWGHSTMELANNNKPALNSRVNLFNKYDAMLQFQKAKVNIPPIFLSNNIQPDTFLKHKFPWFARKMRHLKGQDIQVCQTHEDVENSDADFFSVYIPNKAEFRVWVFNGEVLAVYQKHYREHDIYNFKRFEFRSELLDNKLTRNILTEGSIKAVKALNMDFGAVDVLYGIDNKYYFLEVNSMPEISSYIRMSGIRLARAISKWTEGDNAD